MYTYDEAIFSDMHKDAYGFRPSSDHTFFATKSADLKQSIWDTTVNDVGRAIDDEERLARQCVRDLEEMIRAYVEYCGDRTTAIRWMVQQEEFVSEQDVEYWVWKHGVLFTDEGRDIVKEIVRIREL